MWPSNRIGVDQAPILSGDSGTSDLAKAKKNGSWNYFTLEPSFLKIDVGTKKYYM